MWPIGIPPPMRFTRRPNCPETERQEFLSWLFDLEYRRLGLPKPDLVIYLDMPTELTERMMRRPGGVHRHAGGYSRTGRGIPSSVPGQRPPGGPPCGWTVVGCAAGDLPRSVEDIHQEVWRRIPAAAGVPGPAEARRKWDVCHAPFCPLSAAVGTAAVVSAAAVVPTATAAVAAAAAAAPGTAAAAADQDDDDDEPQAGTVVVSVVKAHDCHLTLRHSMQKVSVGSLTIEKFPDEMKKSLKKQTISGTLCRNRENGGSHG